MKNRTKSQLDNSLESGNSHRSTWVSAAVTIGVLHLAFFVGLVSQGCKKDSPKVNSSANGSGSATNLLANIPKPQSLPGGSSLSGGLPSPATANTLLNGSSSRPNPLTNSAPTYPNTYSNSSGGIVASSNQTVTTGYPPTVGASTPRLNPIDPEPGYNNPSTSNPQRTENSNSNSNSQSRPLVMEGVDKVQPVTPMTGTHSSTSSTNTNSNSTTPSWAAGSANNPAVKSVTPYSPSSTKDVTIQSGDTISRIALQNNCSVDDIIRLNPEKLKDPARIQIGWIIKVPLASSKASKDPSASAPAKTSPKPPAPGTSQNITSPAANTSGKYTVKPGDSLYSISKIYKISWQSIQKANGLPTSAIKPGQELIIPGQ